MTETAVEGTSRWFLPGSKHDSPIYLTSPDPQSLVYSESHVCLTQEQILPYFMIRPSYAIAELDSNYKSSSTAEQ